MRIMSVIAVALTAVLSACSPQGGPAQAEHTATTPATSVDRGAGAPSATPREEMVPAPAGAVVEIQVSDTSFSPGDVTISAGDTITVTNVGQLEHSWTSGQAGLDSGILGPGESYTFTFEAPGTFAYLCTVHPTMTGTVTVA
jgi:plastocyanin